MIDLFKKRYTILRTIYSHQPVGRRALSGLMGMGEHAIRGETNILRNAGLIDSRPAGMILTSEGEAVLDSLREYANTIMGFNDLEQKVAGILNIRRVVIVPGDLDKDPAVLSSIGKAAAVLLSDHITNGCRIAVTGGSSVAAVVNAYVKNRQLSKVLVLPARGGIGKEMEYQSNTIAASFAKKLGGEYRLLHLPDQLTAQAAETLLNDREIRSVIEEVKKADILLCGLGQAKEMAEKRSLMRDQADTLEKVGAVAEAFGYYFNREGEVVFATSSIGLNLSDLKAIPLMVAVAGGAHKAAAIIAVMTGWENGTLVTDESAAREIVNIVS